MNWLGFYLLVALHPVAFFFVGKAIGNWPIRVLVCVLLSLPAVWYCSDYFAIEREHQRMCSEVGGLRVLIQPEKVDRVRLIGRSYANDAKDLLGHYYPRAQIIEAMTTDRASTGYPQDFYVAYVAAPNPRVGLPMKQFPWKEPIFEISTQKVESLATSIFEVSERETLMPHGIKTETRLTKDGRVYAIHTTLVHSWTGIRYPDAVPTWRCPDTNSLAPLPGRPDAPKSEWIAPRFALPQLFSLIFN